MENGDPTEKTSLLILWSCCNWVYHLGKMSQNYSAVETTPATSASEEVTQDLLADNTTREDWSTSTSSPDDFNYNLVVTVTLALCLTAISIALIFVLMLVFYARYREHKKSIMPEAAIKTDPSAHPSCALLANGYQRRVVEPDNKHRRSSHGSAARWNTNPNGQCVWRSGTLTPSDLNFSSHLLCFIGFQFITVEFIIIQCFWLKVDC